jgi:tRNA-specific 2-thiouridylase
MTQNQLSKTLFPLGNLKKSKVREIAAKLYLPVAEKPDSQEICFVPDDNYPKFLIEMYNQQPIPGRILDTQGKVIGKHPGLIYFTIGQRRRIGIASREPLYVIKIDYEHNNIIVGTEKEVYTKNLVAKELNFVSIDNLTEPIKVKAKIRYTHKPAEAEIRPIEDNRIALQFYEPQWAITPGQAVVFYDNDSIIGGGTIEIA